MHSRKKQAQRSVLLEISTKEDIPYALAVCESYGSIANAYSYAGEGDNVNPKYFIAIYDLIILHYFHIIKRLIKLLAYFAYF